MQRITPPWLPRPGARPSYLFWLCAPPKLSVPQQILSALEIVAGIKIAVGPRGSTTPRANLCSKLRVDAVVLGECEETLVRLAKLPQDRWGAAGLCYEDHGPIVVEGGPQDADLADLPALDWSADTVGRHGHHRCVATDRDISAGSLRDQRTIREMIRSTVMEPLAALDRAKATVVR